MKNNQFSKTLERDAKSLLQEWAQGLKKPAPTYVLIRQTGPDHDPFFEIGVQVEGLEMTIGKGCSKREAERQRQYNEYKDRIGEVINGQVKRVEFGNVLVELGQSEALLARDQLLPRETFRSGDRIRAYIMDVRPELRGPQVFLSRSDPGFMTKFFTQEVPEIYEGVIEIKAVARDPGSRSKIAVYSVDKSLDPVGACVGMRGSRVQAVTSELQGEKVDIIPWSSNPAVFIVNALVPAPRSVALFEAFSRISNSIA